MTYECSIERVERDTIIQVRKRVLSRSGETVTTLSGDLSPSSRHWAALVDREVVGCLSVMALRGWALRGMAVLPAYQRRGIGVRLLQAVYVNVNESLWCNARLEVVSFYEKQGWHAVGPIFLMNHERPHQRMIWSPDPD